MSKTPISEVIDDLRGTCQHFDPEPYTIEELEELDQEVFECDQCGWWCDIDEMVEDEHTCLDCAE